MKKLIGNTKQLITGEQATDIAIKYLKTSGYSFIQIISVILKSPYWVIDSEVGTFVNKKMRLKIDIEKGNVHGVEQMK